LFVERGLQLLKQSGYLGYIVPNKFLTIQSGQQLRKLLSQERNLLNLVHFGVEQIFPNRSTYTAILVLSKAATEEFTVDRIIDLSAWRVTKQCATVTYRSSDIGKEPWVFVAAQVQNVFAKMRAVEHQTLEKVADIFKPVLIKFISSRLMKCWQEETLLLLPKLTADGKLRLLFSRNVFMIRHYNPLARLMRMH
jgi:type I restriction-modification system DNA methylase subunit